MNLESARTLCNIGNQLKEAGRLEDAINHYQKALQLQPDCVEALNQLGQIYYLQGKVEEALALVQQAIKIQPDFAEAYKTLGNLLQEQGKIEAAMRAYSKAIEIKPDLAEAHVNLGNMFYKQGRLDEAIVAYKKAIAFKPDLAGGYWNLGNISNQLGRIEEASAYWQRALSLKPDLGGAEFHLKLGNVMMQLGRLDEAIKSFQQALSLNHDLAEAHANLGLTLLRQGVLQGEIPGDKFNLAISSILNAIEKKPNYLPAHQSLYNFLINHGTAPKYFSVFRQISDRYLQVAGETGHILSILLFLDIYLKSGLHQAAKEKFSQLETEIYQNNCQGYNFLELSELHSVLLFTSPHFKDDLAANSNLWKLIAGEYKKSLAQKINTDNSHNQAVIQKHNSSERKLKIGFISKHFARHSVGWCSADIIRELSQITPHLYLYYTDKIKPDDRSKIFEKAAEKVYIPEVKFGNTTTEAVEICKQILQDDLDILVDLDSVTVPIQVEILHSKPAPVCISWLGFEPPFISEENYFLTDWHTHPEGTEKYYIEQLVRMPDSFVAVSGFASKPVNAKTLRKVYRISLDQIVYLCVSGASKLNSELIEAQVKILKQVPDSLLLYKGLGDAEVIRLAYRKACESQGVGLHRVKIIERSPTEEEHRTIYQIADVLLDSYPYNGCTQSLEALWFNLPIVTRVGEQGLARMGYSFLKTLGIEAGIAQSWEEYVSWGIRLGQDAALRQEVREKLVKSKHLDSLAPLWNPKKFAADMYAVFDKLLAKKNSERSS